MYTCCGWYESCLIEFVHRKNNFETLQVAQLGQIQLPFSLLFLCSRNHKESMIQKHSLQLKATMQFSSIPLFTKMDCLVCFALLCFFVLSCGLSSSGCSKAFANEWSFIFLSQFCYVGQWSPVPLNSSTGQNVSRWNTMQCVVHIIKAFDECSF